MSQCIVALDKFCRKLMIPLEPSLEDVKSAIFSKFPELQPADTVLIQVFDEDFKEYIDYDDTTKITSGSRMKVVRLTEATGPPPSPPLTPPPPVANPAELLEVQHAPLNAVDPGVRMSPHLYTFPPTPKDILHNLSKVKSRAELSSTLRHRIVEWLCFDLFRYTVYPGRLYEVASRQLVVRHPNLQDRIGSGYDHWKRALRFKCKFERSKLLNEGEVAAKRDKFGHKRQIDTTSTEAPEQAAEGPETAKRVCRQELGRSVEGAHVEDVHSINGHIAAMQREAGKVVPNTARIADSMERTFLARRKWIAEERPLLATILDEYPALSTKEEIFREFTRMGGDAPIKTMLKLAPRLMPTVLDVAAKKVEPVTGDLLQKADRLDQEERQLMTTLAFLVTLPRTVRETPKFIQTTTVPMFAKHPVAVMDIAGDTAGPCAVQVEDQLFKVDNPVEAVLLAFCLHWVADLCYQPGAKGFYTIVEHLLGLNATKLTGMALSTLSALKEKM